MQETKEAAVPPSELPPATGEKAKEAQPVTQTAKVEPPREHFALDSMSFLHLPHFRALTFATSFEYREECATTAWAASHRLPAL